jgi:hypothetical protein
LGHRLPSCATAAHQDKHMHRSVKPDLLPIGDLSAVSYVIPLWALACLM